MDKSPTQQLRPLLTNEKWNLLEEYLAGEKSRLVTQLCNCNESQLKHLQGQITTMDRMLNLREQLKMELGSNS